MGMEHSRSYYLDGKQIMELRALPDPDRPGKWTTVVRYMRRDKWLSHGWGPLDSEEDAMAMIDAVGIGMEAREAATYLGHVPSEGT